MPKLEDGYEAFAKPDFDEGVDGNEGLFTTSGLPETGHSTAIDDGQVKTAAVEALRVVASQAIGSDRVIARRLRALADDTSRVLASFGIQESKTPKGEFDDLFSTEALEGTEPDGSMTPNEIDEDNEPTDLVFWGMKKPTKDQIGPKGGEEGRGGDREAGRKSRGRSATTPDYSQQIIKLLEALPPDAAGTHEMELKGMRDTLEEMVKGGTGIPTPMGGLDMGGMGLGGPPMGGPPMGGPPMGGSDLGGPTPGGPDMGDSGSDMGGFSDGGGAPPEGGSDEGPDGLTAGRKASKNQTPWRAIKSALRGIEVGGRWGHGEWDTDVQDYGRTLDLNVDTRLRDGTPLVASTVTFSLVQEDAAKRVAKVEVNDAVLGNKTREVVVAADKASAFAQYWARNAERHAKRCLASE